MPVYRKQRQLDAFLQDAEARVTGDGRKRDNVVSVSVENTTFYEALGFHDGAASLPREEVDEKRGKGNARFAADGRVSRLRRGRRDLAAVPIRGALTRRSTESATFVLHVAQFPGRGAATRLVAARKLRRALRLTAPSR